MQKVTKVIPGLLFLLVVIFTGVDAHASGYAVVSDEQRVSMLSDICVVDVVKVHEQENRRFFLPATIRTLSTTYQLEGTVVETLKGQCKAGEIVSEFTTPEGVEYDAFGNIDAYYTLLSLETGLETKVESGHRYILSFMWFDEAEKTHQHDRVDNMGAYKSTIELVAHSETGGLD